jgi:cytochrome b561
MRSEPSRRSRAWDTPSTYGWISIALHWITAILVIVLLFVGSSISTTDPEQRSGTVLLHTSIAVLGYAFLWARIIWRFRVGHPGPLPGQKRVFVLIAKAVHYVTIGAMALMLCSGPLMVWSGGEAIGVLDWFAIPSPLAPHHALRDFLHTVHATCAGVIVTAIVLHLGGVYKHAAFDQDGTFGKMLVAGHDAAPAAPNTVPLNAPRP